MVLEKVKQYGLNQIFDGNSKKVLNYLFVDIPNNFRILFLKNPGSL
jgi:hypothetical protein